MICIDSKTVLSGYPNPQKAARAGVLLNGLIKKVKGAKGHSGLIDGMVLGGFSKAVPDAETPYDWLSVNPENVSNYVADPLCGNSFTLGSYDALFRLLIDIDRPELYRDLNEDMPILLIAGCDDPCVGGEQGKAYSIDRLTRAGFRNIQVQSLQGMRHEILNEEARDEVCQRILSFWMRDRGHIPEKN